MKINKFIVHGSLFMVLVAAAVLRLWNLGSVPPHLAPDEASLGYNAYSILKTGRDEFGEFLPVVFKSFGDYKPGLYVYLTVPSVAIFGLTEFAVRLPSALAGVISVYLIYLIIRNLKFENLLKIGKKFNLQSKLWKMENIAVLVAATNPWLIYFSRGAWEANVSLTLTLAGIYFFLRGLQKSIFLLPSSIFFFTTLLAYQGAKFSTGIVIMLLAIVFWREVSSLPRGPLVRSAILGVIVFLPIVISLFQGRVGRLEVFSVFSYGRPKEYLEKFLTNGNEKVGDLNYYLFHSEPLNFARGILGRWFNHFSAKFLFFEGDWQNPRHSAPNQGMLLLTDLTVLLYGLMVFSRKKLEKGHVFILLWLILAPLPAVLSRDQIHAVRALNMAVPLIILISLGLYGVAKWLDVWIGGRSISRGVNMIQHRGLNSFARRGLTFFLALLVLFYLGSIVYFLDAYFVHVPKHNLKAWGYGYKQIVETVTPIQKNYEKIKVQQSFDQPYIYFLFYQKYDPEKYQKNVSWMPSESSFDVGHVIGLDNIEFVPIDWQVNRGELGTLFVTDPIKISPEDSHDEDLFKVIREIKYPNGRDIAFRIVEVK